MILQPFNLFILVSHLKLNPLYYKTYNGFHVIYTTIDFQFQTRIQVVIIRFQYSNLIALGITKLKCTKK